MVRVVQTFVMIVLMDLVFWDMGNDEEGIQGKAGFAFFISINQIFMSLFSVLLLFLVERPVFLREYAGKMYGVMSYFISKSVIEIPFQLIFPFILAVCVYFAVGMTADAGRFFIFAAVLILDVLSATSLGFFIGCAIQNASVATAMVTILLLPFILFGGFFVNLDDIYVWLRWLQYLSPIRYSTEALLRNEFENNSEYDGKVTFERYKYDLGLGW
jgi:ATP-binding cassette, subfamily G (WHITE), eye pigment precursor transporter